MTYSRRRLVLIGLVSFTAGVLLFAVNPDAGVQAGHNCNSPPCPWPAQPWAGGYTLGVEYLYATGPGSTLGTTMPNNIGQDQATTNVTMSSIEAADYQFIYKPIHFSDADTPQTTDNASILIQQNFTTATNIQQVVGEYTAELMGGGKSGCPCGDSWSRNSQHYWVIQVENDDCGGFTSSAICLGSAGNADFQRIEEGLFRVHYMTADQMNATGIYMEIRHGTAWDRARVLPDDNHCCPDGDPHDELKGPWARPESRLQPFTVPWECTGNQDSGVTCTVDTADVTEGNIYWDVTGPP